MYNLTRFGFSTLHGLHQEAQSSIIVTLPFKSDKLSISPKGEGPSKLGAISPIDVRSVGAFTLSTKIFPTRLFKISEL